MADIEEKVLGVLTEKIDQLERENYALTQKVELFENMKNFGWLAHQPVERDDIDVLPLPRLEMRYEADGHYGISMCYGIVREHYMDGIEFIPLSKTTMSCNPEQELKRVKAAIFSGDILEVNKQLPYRDGIHIKYDSLTLNMPIYICCENLVYPFEISEADKQFIKHVKNR